MCLKAFLSFRQIRLAREMSVEEVADLIGVDSAALVEYEKDSSNMSINLALELCKIYNVPSIDYIYIEERERQPGF